MTRKECLDKAAQCVLQDRARQYGQVENNFERIADLWEAYLHVPVSALDVAMMMALLKVARAKANPAHADSFVDLAGYAACGAECAGFAAEEAAEFEADHKFLESVFGKYKTEADAEPEFKSRDKVQARLGDGVWRDAVVTGKEITCGKLYYTVKVADFNGYYSLQADDVRPAPKAEGCEGLAEMAEEDAHE